MSVSPAKDWVEIRYRLDEHIDPAVAAGLRHCGVDVATTLEAGLASATDEEQVAYALAEGRAIVTRDPDFLVLNSRGASHSGIVFWHSKTPERRATCVGLGALVASCYGGGNAG